MWRADSGSMPGRQIALLLVVATSLALGACATKPAAPTASAAATEATERAAAAAVEPARPMPSAESTIATAEPIPAPAEPATRRATEPELPPLPAAVQQAFAAAVALQRAGRDAEALAAWRALLREHPALAGAHANLGLLQRRSGRLDEALVALEQAVRLSPSQAAFGNQLGVTLRQAGRYADARRAYEAALAAQPEHAASHFNLAILLDVYLGERDAALGHYQRAQVLLPDQAAQVQRWVAELKARKPDSPVAMKKEKE